MKKLSFIKLLSSMVIFGTIGIFIRNINLTRGLIASARGIVGALFILFISMLIKRRPSAKAIRKNLPTLLISGVAIGANWILLFESYSYTTIAISTLCYYMAPVFVIIASIVFLRAKIDRQKICSVSIALVGMLCISGVFSANAQSGSFTGILLALGAAVLYATVTILNKRLKDISSRDRTVTQLTIAGITMLPYTLLFETNNLTTVDKNSIILLFTVCLLHTGIAYLLYFASIKELPATTVAIFSYTDPIVAILISLILREPISIATCIGAILIIASLILSEINLPNLSKK